MVGLFMAQGWRWSVQGEGIDVQVAAMQELTSFSEVIKAIVIIVGWRTSLSEARKNAGGGKVRWRRSKDGTRVCRLKRRGVVRLTREQHTRGWLSASTAARLGFEGRSLERRRLFEQLFWFLLAAPLPGSKSSRCSLHLFSQRNHITLPDISDQR